MMRLVRLALACLASWASLPLMAQVPAVYSSGSTGVDGPFNPVVTVNGGNYSVAGVPAGTRVVAGRVSSQDFFWVVVPLSANGVYNFTTITIPANVRVCFDNRNVAGNPGVVFLATGDITIAGEISVAAEDTLIATTPTIGDTTPNNTTFDSNVAGPGGYFGAPSTSNFGRGRGPNAGISRNTSATVTPLSLPLVGGSGGASGTSSNFGGGGGGTLILASSTAVRFTAAGPLTRGLVFDGGFSRSNFTNTATTRDIGSQSGTGGGDGMAAIFATEIIGTPRSTSNLRMIFSAFRQDSLQTNSVFPLWSSGVAGLDAPVNPSVRITQFGDLTIPAENTPETLWSVPNTGVYNLTLETTNLPVGLVFVITRRTIDTVSGNATATSTYNTTPTAAVSGTVARVSKTVDVAAGQNYYTASAIAEITVADAPLFNGELVNEMIAETDSDGTSEVYFRTSAGTRLPYTVAVTIARQQGKGGFWQTLL